MDRWPRRSSKFAPVSVAHSPLLPAIARPLKNGLRNLHAQFSKAPELGSLIDPTELPGDLIAADYETMLPFLADVMTQEAKGDSESFERAVAAQGMAKAAEILAGDYTLVITNVPYLGRKSHTDLLKSWADANEKEARNDLATMFISRMLRCVGRDIAGAGTIAAVTPRTAFLPATRTSASGSSRSAHGTVARLGPGHLRLSGARRERGAADDSGASLPEEPPHTSWPASMSPLLARPPRRRPS